MEFIEFGIQEISHSNKSAKLLVKYYCMTSYTELQHKQLLFQSSLPEKLRIVGK